MELFFDFKDGTIYFVSSAGVGQYSKPRRFVIHRQAPALLSSVISSNAPRRTACNKIYHRNGLYV